MPKVTLRASPQPLSKFVTLVTSSLQLQTSSWLNIETMDAEKLAKLQKLQSAVRIGGKGTPRRKVKRVAKSEGDDVKLQATLQKLSVQPVPGMEQVNIFKEDGKVISVERPLVQAAVQSNTYAISGRSVEKNVQDLLPEMLQSLGPDSLEQLRKLSEQFGGKDGAAAAAQDDDIPDLVSGETFEDRVD